MGKRHKSTWKSQLFDKFDGFSVPIISGTNGDKRIALKLFPWRQRFAICARQGESLAKTSKRQVGIWPTSPDQARRQKSVWRQ